MASSKVRVTICGGGNGAHVSAGWMAAHGYSVNVFTRRPQDWTDSIKVTTATCAWRNKGTFNGKLNKVTSDPKEAAEGQDVFIVCAPANAHPPILQKIAPYVRKGAWVGALYAQGGFDWACKSIFGSRFNDLGGIFGLQNIPWICKITHYGREARILGPKDALYLAAYPTNKASEAAGIVSQLYGIPAKTMPNFLNLTLTPSNQIIHPARYYGIFRDWDGKKTYTKKELAARSGMTLYEDMDEFSAECLACLDNELQQIKHAILQRYPQLDLSYIPPLGERVVRQYGKQVHDRSSLKKIFSTNEGYVGCGTPVVQKGDEKVMPNVNTRLFWEDIPFGLCILKNLAELMGNFPTPWIDFLIEWHQQFMDRNYLVGKQLNPKLMAETGTPFRYGLHDIGSVVQTSLPTGASTVPKSVVPPILAKL